MPITNPTRDDDGVYESYPKASVYRTDDERVPHYNEPDSGVMFLPGEPVLKEMNGDQYVFLAQGPIKPGKTGMLVYRFVAEFPCDLSADVVEGTPIYWDKDEDDDAAPVGLAKLEGDVTNGYLLGTATYAYDGSVAPEVDGDGNVVCGDSNSTKIWVRSVEGPHPGLGDFEYTGS
jgi:hypothetical protein